MIDNYYVAQRLIKTIFTFQQIFIEHSIFRSESYLLQYPKLLWIIQLDSTSMKVYLDTSRSRHCAAHAHGQQQKFNGNEKKNMKIQVLILGMAAGYRAEPAKNKIK
mmetsp:Transcript_45018/g.73775  ORF Transcript_45018/g.73775 Transcript_45018/m.73775 type:complete len:106 (-) Transcript_45018:144-461(-)